MAGNAPTFRRLSVGGLIAAGFDPSGRYLLTVSHLGRGVFVTNDWQRVARDCDPAYPNGNHAVGIGPLENVVVTLTEINYETGKLEMDSPDGLFRLSYEEGTITVITAEG